METSLAVFDTPEDEVAACARWLDTTFLDWASRVNPDTLVMMSGEHCIGAQLDEDWWELTVDWAEFTGQDPDEVQVFATYTPEWRREITTRR